MRFDWNTHVSSAARIEERDGHLIWRGSPHLWRIRAEDYLEEIPVGNSIVVIVNTCNTEFCLRHVAAVAPTPLAYPRGVCIYCGNPAQVVDHVIPRAARPDFGRRNQRHGPLALIAPACAECNSLLSDFVFESIKERRAFVQEKLRARYDRTLRVVDYPPDELAEWGRSLLSSYRRAVALRNLVRERLAWPVDPFYDERAMRFIDVIEEA